jgi:hypothetical protein
MDGITVTSSAERLVCTFDMILLNLCRGRFILT